MHGLGRTPPLAFGEWQAQAGTTYFTGTYFACAKFLR